MFPANRVAALATWLTGLGAFIASIEGTLPNKWQDTAVGAVGLLTTLVTALHFMSGSQKYDALMATPEADGFEEGAPEVPGEIDYNHIDHALIPSPEVAPEGDPPTASSDYE